MLSPSIFEAKNILQNLKLQSIQLYPKTIDRPLYLYGAGNMGRLAAEFLTFVHVDFEGFLDGNAHQILQNGVVHGRKILSPSQIPEADRHRYLVAVSIVFSPFEKIQRELNDLGFLHVVPFYDISQSFTSQHPLYNGWFLNRLTSEDVEKIEFVLSCLEDKISLAHYLQFLFWRRLRQEISFSDAPINIKDRFFIPEILDVLSESEVFVDCGAHHGEVVKAFHEVSGCQFKKIYAFEPDEFNFGQMKENVESLKDYHSERYELSTHALGESDETVSFQQGFDYVSKVSNVGNEKCIQRRLDSLGIQPTFMKIHVEGGELPLLKGAEKTIKSCRPLLAITFYHSEDGVWKIQDWLIRELQEYRFLIRLHAWCGTGGVIYCIPKERS